MLEIYQYGLAAAHVIAASGLVYLGVKANKRADRWENAARSLAREQRRQAAPTVVAPNYWAPKATQLDSDR